MSYELVDGRVVTPEGCELNVAHHCNLGCASCSHLSPVFRRSVVDPEVVRRDLGLLARFLRARFVKVLGGEPLLHKQLVPILDIIRESGIAPRVLVCTNGVLLPRMRDDFWSRVDEVEVSIYPGRELSDDELAHVRRQAERHQTTLTVSYYSHFRYSYSEVGTEDARLVEQIFTTCQVAHVWRCHTVYEGHFFRCPQAVFLPRVIGRPEDPWADALPIEDRPDLAERLLAYLTSPRPLAACRNCLGSAGRRMPHHQLPRAEFLAPQRRPTEELLDREFLARLADEPDHDDGCAVADPEDWRARVHGVRERI
ncbi:4Fe-4S single cluster domain [Streptoalloteichus tenebrarius]|uniref:AmgF n=2 Tax=Actinomycetes TaxID=1760 RepID=C5HYR0_9ACTN|nr:radical SAM protein [Streptoalloteichus tenebrarius]ACR82899.1 AmgF [Streptomyces sp. KCTC 9047]MCP2258273.1 4Fe-4S single cluster domain [Streptoalloteichus tenebrarius]BFF04496.1 hypothetical protein GCM10020241_61710 [Streptoalloteichus tenebrarius]